ncbi:aspartyl-tRNA synthetase cytoplasmic [Penicillium citrinum]|uniref:Aspartyl-tRNA synthetase cytoplasmic n=1 Tax=Penicillium citrinum TaxID=5077 RepID=A0A9W9TV59_PENCI|nr:aspartyl-tRNA synthetase cytoplasmic [Penicillium citrinum]KAJ5240639.1 aspartyl-tRNA synthetase cytoplasmic [Penicillium citrinum]
MWRDNTTVHHGAAIACYIPGNPLCGICQRDPLWKCWQSVSCIAENRISPSANLISSARDGITKKIQHAKVSAIRVVEIQQQRDTKTNCTVAYWATWDTGPPISDPRLGSIDIVDVIFTKSVVTWLYVPGWSSWSSWSSHSRMQIKYSFDFPGAPSSTIGYILTCHSKASKSRIDVFTLGAAETGHLTAGHIARSMKLYLLQHAYTALARWFQLIKKIEFRMKLGDYIMKTLYLLLFLHIP